MTYIDAESNKSRITCIMVMAESDWMRIQNLPNRIGCGVKKNKSPHTSGVEPLVKSQTSHRALNELNFSDPTTRQIRGHLD